ncbi:MAG: hypothetical protein U0V54_13115 [Saprospiraceae bacterium]|nr:hypothetical protein [Saprospiraceae bacterium]
MKSIQHKPYVSRREKNKNRAFQFKVILAAFALMAIVYLMRNWNDVLSYLKTFLPS